MNVISLQSSVGKKGDNNKQDVITVQESLNQVADQINLPYKVKVDGTIIKDFERSPTCQAIGLLQQSTLYFKKPDYRIDVGGKTHQKLGQLCANNRSNLFLPLIEPKLGLNEQDFQQAANVLSCEVAAIKAVSDVESNGSGYFASGKPKILFEAHIFSKYTYHNYDESHSDISSKTWDRSLYVGGEKEYLRLQKAMGVDRHAALLSASYGRYQIMGFNHKAAGYSDVESFVRDIFLSEVNHLMAFVRLIQSNSQLHGALKAKNWPYFASIYNGPNYSKNHYDEKLSSAYIQHHHGEG